MADYTAWPTAGDVVDVLKQARILFTTRPSSVDYLNRKVAAVTQEVTKRTHRRFVVVRDDDGMVSETRYFDGSGTGTLEVDECVSLTTVSIIGFVGTIPTLTLDNVYLRRDSTYPNSFIDIYQSSLPALSYIYLNGFPAGRQNISVDAVWGYAETVPADLWEAVAEESAKRLAEEMVYDPNGRTQEWKAGDDSGKLLVQMPGEATGWHANFEDKVNYYTRDVSRNLRKMRPAMI